MVKVKVPVRPTKRCLTDLELPLPDLGKPLHEIDDPVVSAAQATPEQRDAGGAQRILSLADRVWFKVKTSSRRAIVTQLGVGEMPNEVPWPIGSWWIGAAGRRKDDSPQHDFYHSIARECQNSTDHLLPIDWDWNRLNAEAAVAWRRELKRLVIHLIAQSLITGKLVVAEFRHHRLKALVRADEGNEAYLAIMAEGVLDPVVFTQFLDCVPGIAPEDWQPEPSTVGSMEPAPGEIVWSTMFPSEVAARIIELDEEYSD